MLTEQQKEKAVKTFKRLIGVELARVYSMHGYQDLAVQEAELITELSLLLCKRLNYIAWLELDAESKQALTEILSECGLQTLLGQDLPITLEHANGRLRKRYRK